MNLTRLFTGLAVIACVLPGLAEATGTGAAASPGPVSLAGTWTLVAADVIHPNGSRARDYGEGRAVLESGRAVAYMMDDVLLAGTRSLTAKPDDWVIVGTPQSSEAYGFMMRNGDPEFRQLVDDTMASLMKSGEIDAMYAKWFEKPVPPKGANFQFPMSEQLRARYAAPNDEPFD